MNDIPEDIFVASPLQASDNSRKIAILTADGTEDQEFFYPYYRMIEAGFAVDVFTPDGGEFKGKNGAGLKETTAVSDADPSEYALLYIPGGKAPEALKKEEDAVSLVQEFCETGKPVAAICHGPQLLAKANVINGKQIAAWPECQDELEEAGAEYCNEACVKDGQFITGRWPADLPHFTAEMLRSMQQGSQKDRRAA